MVNPLSRFNLACTECPRLATFLAVIRENYPTYHGRPVPSFGDENGRLLIVGLAPGLHGANATGRPFTGDFAGILLYQTLYDCGLSNQPESTSIDDGLKLINCRITNAVKCLPPQNKPTGQEINQCNHFLAQELVMLPSGNVIIALGTIAHNAVLKAFNLKLSQYKFKHGGHALLKGDIHFIDSYHCSRYNTQTKRLTEAMFQDVFKQAIALLT